MEDTVWRPRQLTPLRYPLAHLGEEPRGDKVPVVQPGEALEKNQKKTAWWLNPEKCLKAILPGGAGGSECHLSAVAR